MSQPFLISGGASSQNSFPGRSGQPRTGRMLKILVIIWVLTGLGYLVWRFVLPTKPAEPAEPAPSAIIAHAAATSISAEDLQHHMEAVESGLDNATTRLRRAEDLMTRTIPSLQRNYLFVDKQHLDLALAGTEAARRDLEQARQDADLILNSLKEHQLK